MKVRKHFIFTGRVQGVGFRYRAMYIARQLGLTGWVENLWNGNVEMEAQGDAAAVDRMFDLLQSMEGIRIESFSMEDVPLEKRENGFRVMG